MAVWDLRVLFCQQDSQGITRGKKMFYPACGKFASCRSATTSRAQISGRPVLPPLLSLRSTDKTESPLRQGKGWLLPRRIHRTNSPLNSFYVVEPGEGERANGNSLKQSLDGSRMASCSPVRYEAMLYVGPCIARKTKNSIPSE